MKFEGQKEKEKVEFIQIVRIFLSLFVLQISFASPSNFIAVRLFH